MCDEKQEPSQRPDAEPRDPLSQRRPLSHEDDYYDRPLCPCEETEPENQSEYDVNGDWVTYDGPINEDIFDGASRNAAVDLEAQMRAYYQEPVAPPPPSAFTPVPNDDAPEVPKAVDGGNNNEWPAVMAEIFAVELSTDVELEDKEASEGAEKVDALRDPQAAEREKQEPRHFASLADYPVKNLVYNLEDSSQRSHDGVATAESADAQAPQANDGRAAQAEITSAESQFVQDTSGTDAVSLCLLNGPLDTSLIECAMNGPISLLLKCVPFSEYRNY